MPTIDVLLADDHSIVRQGIKSILSREADINITAEASDGREAVRLAKEKSPDVIVMDITMPYLNGLEATSQITKKNKKIKIVILSMHENRAFIEQALTYGAKGYLLKDSAVDEIARAIREVYAGRYFLDSKISSFVVEDFISRKGKSIKRKSAALFTTREAEILQLIVEGLSSKDIAQKLNLSLKTVLAHRNNIMHKAGAHNQAQLIRFAFKEKLPGL